MGKYLIFLSDLAESDRQYIKHCIEMLLRLLKSCEGRLPSYEAEDAVAEGQSVLKLLHDLKLTCFTLDEMQDQLIEKHRLPDDVKQLNQELRQASRNLLTGNDQPQERS